MSALARLDRLLDEAQGEYSVCVQYPGDEPVYTYAADVVRRAASLIKVPLTMALLHSHTGGRQGGQGVDLDEVITLREEDRVQGEGAAEGTFDVAPAGTQRTRWQLIDHALRESDNTAANLLIAAIGMDAVNHFMRSPPLNLKATRLQRRFIDFAAAEAGRENLTTAREMCRVFDLMWRESENYAPLIHSLKASGYDDALVAGLPPRTTAAHKVGTLPGAEHDAGIVFGPNAPYIVVLLSEQVPDEQSGRAMLAAMSRTIYEQMAH